MKVFAIAQIVQPLTPELRQEIMPQEVPATLKHYLDGKIEQFWFRENAGPIFLLNASSLEEAHATVNSLPLTARGIATYELMPVGPLAPLALLIPGK